MVLEMRRQLKQVANVGVACLLRMQKSFGFCNRSFSKLLAGIMMRVCHLNNLPSRGIATQNPAIT